MFSDIKKQINELTKEAFLDGMDLAWELVRKLRHPSYEDTYSDDEKRDIFGYVSSDSIVTHLSASEAVKRVKAWEEKQKDEDIKVGDEILIHNIQDAETYKAVVMDIDMDKGLWIFDENACNTVIEPNRYIGEEADIEVRKTGRHFSQITEVLEQLKGGRDEDNASTR